MIGHMPTNIYPLIIEVLTAAPGPMSTREVFNQLRVPGVKSHDVSKALNNLKAMGRVDSVEAPELGRCAHRWFAVAPGTASRNEGTPLFKITESGALAIATDTIGVIVPPSIVSRLRDFLNSSSDGVTTEVDRRTENPSSPTKRVLTPEWHNAVRAVHHWRKP